MRPRGSFAELRALGARCRVARGALDRLRVGIGHVGRGAFGLYAEGYYTWSPLHAAAAKALLALLLVHMAVHAGSLYNLLKRRGVAKAAAHGNGGFDDERRSA